MVLPGAPLALGLGAVEDLAHRPLGPREVLLGGVDGVPGLGLAVGEDAGGLGAGLLDEPEAGGLGVLLTEAEIQVVPVTAEHRRVALSAWTRFGRGRHPAALNLGDCLSYAVAALAQRPLLCIGDDFARTDLRLVELP